MGFWSRLFGRDRSVEQAEAEVYADREVVTPKVRESVTRKVKSPGVGRPSRIREDRFLADLDNYDSYSPPSSGGSYGGSSYGGSSYDSGSSSSSSSDSGGSSSSGGGD